MQFTSLAYFGFFAVVFALYWAVPHSRRTPLCLLASVGFYAMFGLPMLAVLALCTVASYFGARWLAVHRGSRKALALAMVLALAPLVVFKYGNGVLGALAPQSAFSLFFPVGISFYSFKIIAYLAEVYKGMPLCASFTRYALYVTFFPEVTSGPIQRPADLLAQLETPRTFSTQRAVSGAQLVLWGLFKKLVLADNLAGPVKVGFTSPDTVIGGSVVLAALLYAVQLYCDFSGYSDMAIGCMELLGFSVPDNFRSPYFSQSIKDFWNRWHVSLSGFLRDYVYIPLGGSRCSTTRSCINLMVTFLVSGLWHGTGLQFLVWGGLHGAFLVAGRLTLPWRTRLRLALPGHGEGRISAAWRVLVTFLLVTAAWVPFGAQSLPQALHLFARMGTDVSLSVQGVKNAFVMLGLGKQLSVRYGAALAVLCGVDFASRRQGFAPWLRERSAVFQTVLCYALVLGLLFLAPAQSSGFIYFQF